MRRPVKEPALAEGDGVQLLQADLGLLQQARQFRQRALGVFLLDFLVKGEGALAVVYGQG